MAKKTPAEKFIEKTNKTELEAKDMELKKELANLSPDPTMSETEWAAKEAVRLKVPTSKIHRALKHNLEEADNQEARGITEISPEQENEIVTAKEILASKQEVLMEIGKLQAFNNFKNYATVAEIISYKKIKESKQYKGLVYEKEGKTATVATLEEFCPVFFGRSYRTLNDLEAELDTFGEEFFESSRRIGLGNRELRKLRQLPDNSRAMIIDSEAVELGDKEAIKDLIEDYTYQKEDELKDVTGALNEAEAQLKANREMSNETAVKLQESQEELAKRKFTTTKWEDETKDFFAAAAKVHNTMYESLGEMLSLNEQLHFTKMDDRAKEAATSAFYADTKLLVERFALTWNEIYQTIGVIEETAKPSGEWLAEMGFEGVGEDE